STTPVPVPGLENVMQIAARGHMTFAVLADGSVRTWGLGCDGRLGVPDNNCGLHATPMQPQITGVSKLTAGYDSVCALRADRTVWCWGPNWFGQCGDSSYDTRDH